MVVVIEMLCDFSHFVLKTTPHVFQPCCTLKKSNRKLTSASMICNMWVFAVYLLFQFSISLSLVLVY